MKKVRDSNAGQMSTNLPVKTMIRLRCASKFLMMPICDIIEISLDTIGIPKTYDPRVVKEGYKLMFDKHLATIQEHGENQEMVDFFKKAGEDDQ